MLEPIEQMEKMNLSVTYDVYGITWNMQAFGEHFQDSVADETFLESRYNSQIQATGLIFS